MRRLPLASVDKAGGCLVCGDETVPGKCAYRCRACLREYVES